jgi:CheY-like chemotaxis protein
MEISPRVLVVEDVDYHMDIFEELVQQLGYEVIKAVDLDQALERLKEYLFDVALVDLRLNDNDPKNWDGMKVLYRIRDMSEGTRVIVLTAYGEVEHAAEAFRAYGVRHFVRKKNIDISEVKAEISKAVKEGYRELGETNFSRLITGMSPARIYDTLRYDKRDDLESFLKSALSDLRPLFPDRKDAEFIQGGFDRPLIEARFWSKALGSAILLRFGSPDAVKDEAERPNAPNKIRVLLDRGKYESLGGVVYILEGIPLSQFKAPKYPSLPDKIRVPGVD